MLDQAHEKEIQPEEVLLAHMDIGDQAETFLKSDLGRVLTGLARQEAEEALDQLKTVKPDDVLRIQELQGTIRRAESFNEWLIALMSRGREAYRELIDRKGDE